MERSGEIKGKGDGTQSSSICTHCWDWPSSTAAPLHLCDGQNQPYCCWAGSLDAPPSSLATATALAMETAVTVAGTCSHLLCSCSSQHYFRKLQSPEEAYSSNVVIAGSRSRKTALAFHLSSKSLECLSLVDFKRSHLVREFGKCSFEASGLGNVKNSIEEQVWGWDQRYYLEWFPLLSTHICICSNLMNFYQQHQRICASI